MLRTRSRPSVSAGIGTETSEKSDSFGMPTGRAARTNSRLTVGRGLAAPAEVDVIAILGRIMPLFSLCVVYRQAHRRVGKASRDGKTQACSDGIRARSRLVVFGSSARPSTKFAPTRFLLCRAAGRRGFARIDGGPNSRLDGGITAAAKSDRIHAAARPLQKGAPPRRDSFPARDHRFHLRRDRALADPAAESSRRNTASGRRESRPTVSCRR